MSKEPTYGSGKICYVDIPAEDIAASADFYQKTFGWNVRTRGDGSVAFDDGAGEVSGTWSTGRPPATPGFVIYIMADSVEETIKTVEANGGAIVQRIGADAAEITARFSDPEGNIVGLYQQPA
jgi:predicted enzyme related to lactoylglutathione lyase